MLGSLYTCCLFLGILNAIFVQPVMSDERAVMYRERGAGMYAIIPWYTGLVSPVFQPPIHVSNCLSQCSRSPMLYGLNNSLQQVF